jgi:hypothetical protein
MKLDFASLKIRTNLKSLVLREAVELRFNKDFTFKNHTRGEGLASSKKLFIPTTSLRTKGGYRLLILNGHRSHLTPRFDEIASPPGGRRTKIQ